jgi:ATP-dependent DNA helicase MPH1
MTGASVSAKERERLVSSCHAEVEANHQWEDRRVFYCTPQTLDNDLKRGAVDPRDIVLAVFGGFLMWYETNPPDEAHKASGSYAYTTILAYITAHHPFFRVLALTATPGGDVPKVQGVVDALHISRIEIREAEAPEIRKYMNEKVRGCL